MGMFDFLFNSNREQRTMLYFKENGNFKFQKMDVEDTFLLEKKNGRPQRAWKLFYKLQLIFNGYKNIKRDLITIEYARDIVYDPFNLLDEKDRPGLGMSENNSPWLTDVTNTQCFKRQEEATKKMALSTQVALLGIPTVLISVAAFIIILVNMGD